jgi:hypothetical protein
MKPTAADSSALPLKAGDQAVEHFADFDQVGGEGGEVIVGDCLRVARDDQVILEL